MLLTKAERRQQVRPVSCDRARRMQATKRKYLLQRHTELLALGMKQALADRALEIWTNGVKTTGDIRDLDTVANFLDSVARRSMAATKKAAVQRPVRLAA